MVNNDDIVDAGTGFETHPHRDMEIGTQSVELPEAPFLHLFVPRGAVTLEGAGSLATGDAVRVATGGQTVTATEPAEILVWEMHATIAA